jgi:hypothetical protein
MRGEGEKKGVNGSWRGHMQRTERERGESPSTRNEGRLTSRPGGELKSLREVKISLSSKE